MDVCFLDCRVPCVYLFRSPVNEPSESPGDHWSQPPEAVRELATQGECTAKVSTHRYTPFKRAQTVYLFGSFRRPVIFTGVLQLLNTLFLFSL